MFCIIFGTQASDANLGVKSGAKNHALTNAELPVLSGSIVMHSSNTGTNIQTVNGIFKPAITNNGKYRGGGDLVDVYKRQLSAILIGNNVVNLTASSISTVIATSLLGQQGTAVATAVITVLVLVFGEILPKSFAKDHAERVSMAMGLSLIHI